MEGMKAWVKNIVFYMILITTIMNVLPDNQYKKYIKLFTGLLMLILIMAPVGGILQLNDKFNYSYITKSFEQELNSAKSEIQLFENAQTEGLQKAYKDEIESHLREIAKENGLYVFTADTVLSEDLETFGEIREINMTVSYTEENSKIGVEPVVIGEQKNKAEGLEELKIKNEIQSFYNVERDNINITIQR